MKLLEATITLFNGIYQETKTKENQHNLKRTINNGYVISPNINNIDDKTYSTIESLIGINGIKSNSTFHKSWATIKNTDLETLAIQQIMHYITSYGFQQLDIYDENTVYYPIEILDIPECKHVDLIIVKDFNKKQLTEKIIELDNTGIALQKDTLIALMTIIKSLEIVIDVDSVKNKEFKSKLQHYYHTIPKQPLEWLRYAIQELTGESLLIKNENLIYKIKSILIEEDVDNVMGELLNGIRIENKVDEIMKTAPPNLAEIFYRFKPLFLALKSIASNKTFFNQLRRKAKRMHKPMSFDYLNNVTNIINQNKLSISTLQKELNKVNIWRKIRLLYSLKMRMSNCDSVIYQVRNNKGWVTKRKNKLDKNICQTVFNIVEMNIINDLNIKDKTFLIEPYVHYALPSSEKQFIGNIPNNTFIDVKENMLVGIWWENTYSTVDLDLASISLSGKTGWDANWDKNGILFSGDMVTAKRIDQGGNGAAECIYIEDANPEPQLLTLNYFNFKSDKPKCNIYIAEEHNTKLECNHMVDPNTILANTIISIENKQNVIGCMLDHKFCFTNVSVGGNISSFPDEQMNDCQEFLKTKILEPIMLEDILTKAGANIINEATDEIDYIDLRIKTLDKTSIIKILS